MQLREAFISKIDAICREQNIIPQLKVMILKQRESRSWVENTIGLKS